MKIKGILRIKVADLKSLPGVKMKPREASTKIKKKNNKKTIPVRHFIQDTIPQVYFKLG